MLELLSDPNVWAAFLTLTAMEIVLGIDNIVFISVLVSRLPKEQADRARKIGLTLALVFRIMLLLVISWIVSLTQPAFALFGFEPSWKDLILIVGGGFLIYKATHEMHAELDEPHEHADSLKTQANMAYAAILGQIVIIDAVFSVDSIITAVGMVDQVEIMIAAVIVAVGVMFVASGPVADFVAKHPTTKMLALAFLLLIGTSLVADGFGFHIPKGYLYSAMGFSILVEAVNIIAKERRNKRGGVARTQTTVIAELANSTPAPAAAATTSAATPAKPKARATSTSRAQSRPKSAPRK